MQIETLTLKVEDFGPIQQAELELRPLTLFIGPSNTGKSYLATLIYALHKHSQFDYENWWHAEHLIRKTVSRQADAMADELHQAHASWAKENAQSPALRDSENRRPDTWKLTPTLKDLAEQIYAAQFVPFRSELERCFGSSVDTLTRSAVDSAFRFEVCRSLKSRGGEPMGDIQFTFSDQSMEASFPDSLEIETSGDQPFAHLVSTLRRIAAGLAGPPEDLSVSRLIGPFRDAIVPGLVGSLASPAHYLPTSRSALLDMFDIFVSSLIDTASSPAETAPKVTGVVSDFMNKLARISGEAPTQDNSRTLDFEEKLLAGRLAVHQREATRFPRFSYQPAATDGQELPLKNASSMVSELAPIHLYDKYLVKRGDLLIVDEPESHLHPALQVELTNYLAGLVQDGRRILITTHSEWVLEALSNIVRRPKSPTADDQAPHLDESAVGAWLFRHGEGDSGASLKEICLDESGMFPSEFDEVATSLHNEWARITDSLKERG